MSVLDELLARGQSGVDELEIAFPKVSRRTLPATLPHSSAPDSSPPLVIAPTPRADIKPTVRAMTSCDTEL